MSEIVLIGVGEEGLGDKERTILAGCGLVVASSRHRPLVEKFAANLLPIAPLAAALDSIEAGLGGGQRVGVLASGDPLFYGIGRTLISRFGREKISVLPALSAMQLACARLCMPWDDARILSLHGRSDHNLAGRVLAQPRTILFTDQRLPPQELAAKLGSYLGLVGAGELGRKIKIHVAENLGRPDERLTSGDLETIAAGHFGDLNMVVVETPAPPIDGCRFGLTEPEIRHSRGLITKDEVRAVTLHRLRLPAEGVLWDVGGGSGSVSVEAARLAPGLAVFCIEQKAEELVNIRHNIVRQRAFNITPVAGRAPEALAVLPAPDRVFVGGSSGALADIISHTAGRLHKNGRIVVNCVTEKTGSEAPRLLADHGLRVECSEIRVSRRTFSANKTQRKEYNPITIVTGAKRWPEDRSDPSDPSDMSD